MLARQLNFIRFQLDAQQQQQQQQHNNNNTTTTTTASSFSRRETARLVIKMPNRRPHTLCCYFGLSCKHTGDVGDVQVRKDQFRKDQFREEPELENNVLVDIVCLQLGS